MAWTEDHSKSLGMLVLTPDAAELGLTRPILCRAVQQTGSSVMGALLHRYTAYDTLITYRNRTSTPRTSKRDASLLIRELFNQGPCLVAIFKRQSGDDASSDLQRDLARVKGPSPFGKASQEQIRSVSKICDRTLSLVHSPDDAEGFLFELGSLTHCDPRSFLKAANSNPPSIDELDTVFSATRGLDGSNPVDVVLRLIRDFCILCRMDLRNSSGPSKSLPWLGQLDQVLRQFCSESVSDTWDACMTLVPKLSELAASLSVLTHKRLAWLLTLACQPAEFGKAEAIALGELARGSGLRWSSWDQHRLSILVEFHRER